MPSVRYQKYKDKMKEYVKTHKQEINEYMRTYLANYRTLYKEKTNEQFRKGNVKILFGGLREKVLERDNYTCISCGMTDKAHKEKWNRSITIDHIDGNGRYTPLEKKNNTMENLQTLCLSCHGRKDRLRALGRLEK